MAELTEAKDNYLLGKLKKRIRQADLLILDKMSYVSFDRFGSETVFKVVSDRSERGSVIVTTNLPFSQWTELFCICSYRKSSKQYFSILIYACGRRLFGGYEHLIVVAICERG